MVKIARILTLTLIDGAKVHYVNPHKGDRWSLVLSEHNKIHDMTRDQSDFLASLEFKVYDDKVSELERRTDYTLHNQGRYSRTSPQSTCDRIDLGLIPQTFAVGKLGFSGKSLTISADQD